MSEHPHKFRYLLPPGSNFQFMAKAKFFMVLAVFVFLGTIGALAYNKVVRGEFMNWTIDFKGGTEVTLIFRDKADASKLVKADPHKVREALKASGEEGFDVSSADVPEKIRSCRMCTAAPATTGCGPKATSSISMARLLERFQIRTSEPARASMLPDFPSAARMPQITRSRSPRA